MWWNIFDSSPWGIAYVMRFLICFLDPSQWRNLATFFCFISNVFYKKPGTCALYGQRIKDRWIFFLDFHSIFPTITSVLYKQFHSSFVRRTRIRNVFITIWPKGRTPKEEKETGVLSSCVCLCVCMNVLWFYTFSFFTYRQEKNRNRIRSTNQIESEKRKEKSSWKEILFIK